MGAEAPSSRICPRRTKVAIAVGVAVLLALLAIGVLVPACPRDDPRSLRMGGLLNQARALASLVAQIEAERDIVLTPDNWGRVIRDEFPSYADLLVDPNAPEVSPLFYLVPSAGARSESPDDAMLYLNPDYPHDVAFVVYNSGMSIWLDRHAHLALIESLNSERDGAVAPHEE